MSTWLWVVLLLFCAVVAATAIMWAKVSYDTFPNNLKPGEEYEIDGRKYRVPNLPHKRYKSNGKSDINSDVPMLDKNMLSDLRSLIDCTFSTLRESETEFWVTGGTLISAILWKHLMCYDDDCDIAVNWKDREYIWGEKFTTLLHLNGLETFFLRGATLNTATREGSCVRVRKKGTIVPTLDIFFVKERDDGKFAKVNTWSGNTITYNEPSELWDSAEWIYPLHEENIDGMIWPIANRGEDMLDRQYTPEWRHEIQSPDPMTKSHSFAFGITNFFGAWRIGKPSSEEDRTKLINN